MRDTNSQNKYNLLGEPIGTANNKLKKSILFYFAQKLGLDICFRCNEKIENINNFSIEHKSPWQSAENPIESFYDLENISFSHLHCNISAGRRQSSFPSMQGEKHYNAKLSNETVINIKKDILDGMENKDVGEKYGLDNRYVSHIKTGIVWKNIN